MLICINLVCCPVDLERRILDTVCVSPRDTTVVVMPFVYGVVAGVVPTKYYITFYAVTALYEQVAYAGAIGYELRTDPGG